VQWDLSPSNDTRSAAISINHELEKTTLYGSNIGSSSESGEPIHAGVGGGRSVWWKWTAPSTGEQTITTLGSDFDIVLAIYRLDGSGNLQVVASDDDLIDGIKRTSEVAFMTTAGEPYFIAVDGFEGYEGRDYAGAFAIFRSGHAGICQPTGDSSDCDRRGGGLHRRSGGRHPTNPPVGNVLPVAAGST